MQCALVAIKFLQIIIIIFFKFYFYYLHYIFVTYIIFLNEGPIKEYHNNFSICWDLKTENRNSNVFNIII